MSAQTLVALLAVIVSFLAVLSGLYYQTREDRRNRDRERWKQQSDLRERLRPEYVRLLKAAGSMQTVLQHENFVVNTQTQETRDQALAKLLADSLRELDEALVRLALEGRGDVVNAIHGVWDLFIQNRSAKGVINFAAPETRVELVKQMTEHQEAINAAADRLREALVADLQSLTPPGPEGARQRALVSRLSGSRSAGGA